MFEKKNDYINKNIFSILRYDVSRKNLWREPQFGNPCYIDIETSAPVVYHWILSGRLRWPKHTHVYVSC